MTNEVLDRAAGFATCAILATAGSRLVGIGVSSLSAAGAGTVPLTLGSLSLLGAGFACQPTDVGPAPGGGGINGCQEIEDGGYGQVQYAYDGENWQNWTDFAYATSKATSIGEPEVYQSGNGTWGTAMDIAYGGGGERFSQLHASKSAAERVQYRISPIVGSCKNEEQPNLPEPPPEIYDPIPYTDDQTGCTYNVQLLGFVEQVSGGTQDPVYVISGSDALRANGGVIGGCNFSPTVYYGGSGGGGDFGGGDRTPPFPYVPGDDGDGTPNWLKTLKDVAVGAAAALVGKLIADSFAALFATEYPGLIYRMVSVCEKDAQGEPISEAVEVPIPALRAPDAQLARLDAIVELLQASKNFKQPICGNEKPELLGDWVTTRWESDEKMVDSGRRLRKLFRYRSQSSRDLGQLSTYWRDFTWRAGPVCVRHQGAWWGDPQVWAESAEEGKRVIRHAAAEAGLDPDQTGRWAISSSRSPRYGMSGTMKILKKEGFPWVASRQGPDWPNYLARSSDP
jgi:hypothetical protein